MKKVVLFAASIAIATIACAQKPAAGDMGVTFGVTGINFIGVNTAPSNTGTLVFKYLIADDMTARAGLMFNKGGTSSEATVAGEKTTTETSTSGWGLSVGASKHFSGTDRLDPYFGADLFFTNTGGSSNTRTETVDAALAGGTNGDFKETDTENGKTTTFGLIPVVGFNYFLAEKLALGAEFGWGVTSSSTGEGKTVNTGKTGGVDDTKVETTTGTSKATTIGTSGSGSITMTIFF